MAIGAVRGGAMMLVVVVLGRSIIIIAGPPCQCRSGSGRGEELSPIWCPKSAQDSRQTESVLHSQLGPCDDERARHNGAEWKSPPTWVYYARLCQSEADM